MFRRNKPEPPQPETRQTEATKTPAPVPNVLPTIRKEGQTTMAMTPNKFPSAAIPQAPAPIPPAPNLSMNRPAPAPASRPGANERRSLVVGRGIALAGGAITDCERLEVHGTVEASLNHALELIIADSGVFRGEVEIDDADISGAFDGAIVARGRLVVRATGKINGTIRCHRLTVEDGAQVAGKIEMLPASSGVMSMPLRQVAETQSPGPMAPDLAEPAFARG